MEPEPIDWVDVLNRTKHSELSILRIAIFMLCSLTALSLLSLAFALGLQRIVKKVISAKDLESASSPRRGPNVDRPGFFKNTYFVEPPLLNAVIRNA